MINLTEARGLLARAVLTQGPDFVYCPDGQGVCRYEPQPDAGHEGDPRRNTGCLVGVALDLAGEFRHRGVATTVGGLRTTYPDMMTRAAMIYFDVAQRKQDMGEPWGKAYAAAESEADAIPFRYSDE